MGRALIVLNGKAERERAIRWIQLAPSGTRVTFQRSKRTIDQNSRMWAMLTEIARLVPWHGVTIQAQDYKLIFMAALRQEMRIVPNLAGDGFVNIGVSSSDLSKSEMSDLIELMNLFAAERGIVFSWEEKKGDGSEGTASEAG